VDELWFEETSPYLPRLIVAKGIADELRSSFAKRPGVFFTTKNPTPGASVAIRLGVYANNIFSTSLLVSCEIENQWRRGQFVLVPLSSRFLIESWGAVHFARTTLDRLIKDSDVQREENRVSRLTFGSRLDKQSEVELPFIDGGSTSFQSFNVMCFIDSLSELGSEPREAYNFLSEASHPNFIQSSYFQLAGPPLPNWKNESYKFHGHQLLERTVKAIELATSGIQSDIAHILDVATHYIENEMVDNKS
jgi:hypothetical protein